MTVVSVSNQNTRLDTAETATDWVDLGGGSGGGVGADFVFQGSNSYGRQMITTGIRGIALSDNVTTDITGAGTYQHVIFKVLSTTPGLLETYVNGGYQVVVGSSATDIYHFYMHGSITDTFHPYPKLRSWRIIAVDPNNIAYRDSTTGTPALGSADYYGLRGQLTASARGFNYAMDAVDLGGGLTLIGGDSTDPDGIWQDFIDYDEGTSGNNFGYVSTIDDVIFAVGSIIIGTATATVFNDSNRTILWPDQKCADGFQSLQINLSSATTDVDFSSCTYISQGKFAVKKFFDTITDVDAVGEDITITAHGLQTGDYVTYSDEGGTDTIGLTDTNSYWVQAIDADTVSFHTTRQDAYNNASLVNLSDGSGGENHSIVLNTPTAADFTVSNTSGSFDSADCIYNGFKDITLTSACSLTGGQIISGQTISLSTGSFDAVAFSNAQLEEGNALLDPLTELDNITNCTFVAGDEGHIMRITSTTNSPFDFDGNTLTGYWTPTISGSNNGWEFHTQSGVEPTTDIITTNAAHGFSTGDAVYYNDEGGSDTVGLTDLAKYYVNAQSTTTVSLHRSKENANSDTNKIALSDGSTGETHSLYSSKAAIFNDSGGAITINVLNGGTTPYVRNGSGASSTVQTSVTIEVTGVTEGSRVSMHRADNGTELLNALAFTSDGLGGFKSSTGFNYITDTAVDVRARSSGKPVAAIADDNGSYTDETVNANSAATNDMNLLPTTPVVNQDRYIIGHTEQFSQMKLDVGTAGTGGFTITWQYWNGAWTNLTGVTDGTSSLSNSGENTVSWTIPGDWATTTINSQGPYYYIRAAYTAGTVTITPLGRKTTLDVTRYLPFNQQNTIGSSGLSVKAVWIEDTVAQF